MVKYLVLLMLGACTLAPLSYETKPPKAEVVKAEKPDTATADALRELTKKVEALTTKVETLGYQSEKDAKMRTWLEGLLAKEMAKVVTKGK